ncbi:transposase [Candidatus Kaiserbacteria bacterium]|nr:transposase [Candidatus Kaiserbacteria bacterium]
MDHARFVHDMYEFNDSKPAGNAYRRFGSQMMDLRNPSFDREPIVDIHGWCLMKNHYHLLLSERREGGLSTFLRKLNVGYANYFNERNTRAGTLFQGRTKKILIDSDAHFLHILHYIHLNPLDFLKGAEQWRSLRVRDADTALKHLSSYRWSSYMDYCGERNFPSVVTTSLFGNIFKDYRRVLSKYVRDIELTSIKPLLLE